MVCFRNDCIVCKVELSVYTKEKSGIKQNTAQFLTKKELSYLNNCSKILIYSNEDYMDRFKRDIVDITPIFSIDNKTLIIISWIHGKNQDAGDVF